jgi:hypothetical protein
VKTAFFQFKIVRGSRANIEARQLEDAAIHPAVFERSFVLAVEPANSTIRLESARSLQSGASGAASQTVAIDKWQPFSEWLLAWLGCTIGPWSSGSDQKSIERLLRQYAVADPEAVARHWEVGPDYYPAKSWLSATFEPASSADKPAPPDSLLT